MLPEDFFNWPNLASQQKLKKTQNRIYLSDIVEVKASRGSYTLLCKTNYDQYSPYQELDFLQKKAMKGISVPKPHSAPVGFPQEKKRKLLQTLGDILPEK